MTLRYYARITLPVALLGLLFACGGSDDGGGAEPDADTGGEDVEPFSEDCTVGLEPQGDIDATTDAALEVFIEAEPGDVICFNAGDYLLRETLSLGADDVEIRGEGRDDVVLDFAEQDSGTNGIDVANVENFEIRSLSIVDAGGEGSDSGDGIRIENVTGAVVDDLRVDWRGEPESDNGDYGIYPVNSQNVIVENSVVSGSSDAGIYLGQSETAILRGNEVFENVAGIEVENSTHVDVYENEVYDNTGGILIFNLPELQRKEGELTRVFDNEVYDNNRENFADGGIVSMVPTGSGFLVIAVQDVEVFDNLIENHDSIGVGIVSYDSVPLGYDDDEYYPYAERINVHSNTIIDAGDDPDTLAEVLTGLDAPFPAIVWDGIINDDLDPEEYQSCFDGNVDGDGDPVDYVNFGADEGEEDTGPEFDDGCERDPLPAVEL